MGHYKEIDRENQEIDIDVHDALSAVFGPPVVSTEDIVVYSGAPPYTWIRDIGHAWLQVSKREYELNGFQASRYSYQDEKYVYLEEDVDAPEYLNLYQPNPPEIPEVRYKGLCPVRQFARIGKPSS